MNRTAFVVMPFSGTPSTTQDEWTGIFDHVFKPAFSKYGYECTRAEPETGSLIKTIVEQLASSSIVLADLTDQKPNVFYELGVRHSLSRRTILATQDFKHVPSDLNSYWGIQYGIKPAEVVKFSDELGSVIAKIEKDPNRADSPVSEYLEQEERSIYRYEQKENLRKLTALLTEFTIHVILLNNYIENRTTVYDSYIPLHCLRKLLVNRYIDMGHETFQMAYELDRTMSCLPSGNIPIEIAGNALIVVNRLIALIGETLQKVESGSYTEPEKMSQVAWMPSPALGSVSGNEVERKKTQSNSNSCENTLFGNADSETYGLCPACGGSFSDSISEKAKSPHSGVCSFCHHRSGQK